MAKIRVTQTCTLELKPHNYEAFGHEETNPSYRVLANKDGSYQTRNTPPTTEEMVAMEQALAENDPDSFAEVFCFESDSKLSVELVEEAGNNG